MENASTWQVRLTKVCLVLTLFLYPFNNFPFGPFAKLTFYPLLALLILNAKQIVEVTAKEKVLRALAWAGGAWSLWLILSLLFSIGFKAIGFIHVKAIASFIRFFLLWYVFVACCFLCPREDLKRLFYWTLVALFGCAALYATLEYLHFSGVAWATETLKVAIGYFLRTGITEWTGGNVWPPVLWDSERYRSFFEEPAYFSVLLGVASLVFLSCAWATKRKWILLGNLFLAGLAMLLLCKTKSAAGALSFMGAGCVWSLLSLCFLYKMSWARRLKTILFVALFLLGGVAALMTQRHSSSQIASLAQVSVQTEAKPSTTRSIHLAAEFDCIQASPIYGHGMGEYDPVMRKALAPAPYKTHELSVWLSREGALPWLNWWSGMAVMVGLVGLLLFLAWFACPTLVLWFVNIKILPLEHLFLSAALSLFLAAQMTSANTELFAYMLLMTLPLLLVTEKQA